jgi:LmbE family N-acetylglucosaminyl deacetylase
MTLGELGSIDGKPDLLPEAVKELRLAEFQQAMGSLGANYENMGYEDFGLSMLPFKDIAVPLMNILRKNDFGAVFSFHPYEITPIFDHPDHNMAGLATRFAAAGQDVNNFEVGKYDVDNDVYQATEGRPELYFWTTDSNQANKKIKLTKESRNNRNNYLINNYGSQFPSKSKTRWGKIFDKITDKGLFKGHQEYYQQVR